MGEKEKPEAGYTDQSETSSRTHDDYKPFANGGHHASD